MIDIHKRLKDVISFKNQTLKDYSRNSKIPYVTLQRYFSGKQKPTINLLYEIVINFDIDMTWLLTGNGSMYREEKKEIEEKQPKWLTDWWQQSDEAHKYWLEIQLKQTKPNLK